MTIFQVSAILILIVVPQFKVVVYCLEEGVGRTRLHGCNEPDEVTSVTSDFGSL